MSLRTTLFAILSGPTWILAGKAWLALACDGRTGDLSEPLIVCACGVCGVACGSASLRGRPPRSAARAAWHGLRAFARGAGRVALYLGCAVLGGIAVVALVPFALYLVLFGVGLPVLLALFLLPVGLVAAPLTGLLAFYWSVGGSGERPRGFRR